MAISSGKRAALEKAGVAEGCAQEAEVAQLRARVRELEQTNEALGKAIGLLHAMNVQEPDAVPTTIDPDVSSRQKTS